MQKNRNAIIMLVSSLGVMFLIFWGFTVYIKAPLQQEITKKKAEKQDLEQRLADAQRRAQQLDRIRAEMDSLQVEVVELEKQLPKDRELPGLLRVFTHRAESFGLALSTFSPRKPVSKGTYEEAPYDIAVTTSFHSLGRFLTAMGKGERLFATRNLVLNSASSKTDPSKTVNATFTLIAFKYHE